MDDITFVNGTCEEKKLSYVTKLQNMKPHQDMKGEPGNVKKMSFFNSGFLPMGQRKQFRGWFNFEELGIAILA